MVIVPHCIEIKWIMQVYLTNLINSQEILSALPESVYCKDKQGVYLYCSQRMADMAGCASPAEIIGKTDRDLIWHAHADELRANDLRVMDEGKTLRFEERGHTAVKGLMIVRTIKSPLLSESGEVIGVVGISFDVTDLIHDTRDVIQKLAADSAMQRAESLFLKNWYQEVSGQEITQPLSLDEIGNRLKTYMEAIIDKLPANIYWMGLDGRILGCNQLMASVLGCEDRYALIGRNSLQYYEELDAQDCMRNNEEALVNGEVLVFEETAQIEGEERVFVSYKSAIRDNDGKPISLVGVSFDITERKHMERELKIAKEEAEAANLAKLHFMNNMRHDLRTPLSCVVGSARVLKAMETDPDKVEFIEGILKSSQNLLQMLTNMLEFNHIQSQEKSVEWGPVKIVKLAQDLVDMLQLTAKDKDLDLALQIQPGCPEVLISDSYRMQRVLLNLMNNALKFTHRGGVTILLDGHEDQLSITVKDSGIGIAPDRKDTIFEKFVRLNDSDKGLYEGEGLGLAIVKQFVEDLGGELRLESQEGIGSAFTVVLPLLQDAGQGVAKDVKDEGLISRRLPIGSENC
jgi:PAS domain S-box-containing protein